MRAVIPVAGFGTRLKPHTHSLPKVLLNVGGKPILGHIIEKMLKEGITEATLILGHLGEMIEEYIQSNYPELKFKIENIIVDDAGAAVVWSNKGRFKSGEPYMNQGITLVQIREGKIVLISDYFKDTSFLNRT